MLLPSPSSDPWDLLVVLSSPLPDLPPAVSPRESELFSPVSLWFEVAGVVAGALVLLLSLAAPLSLLALLALLSPLLLEELLVEAAALACVLD